MTTTAHFLQPDSQLRRYKQIFGAKFCYYVTEHKSIQEFFVQPLTYVCNTQVHCSINTSPFSLVLNNMPFDAPLMNAYTSQLAKQTKDSTPQPIFVLLHSRTLALSAKTNVQIHKSKDRCELRPSSAGNCNLSDRNIRIRSQSFTVDIIRTDDRILSISALQPNHKLRFNTTGRSRTVHV